MNAQQIRAQKLVWWVLWAAFQTAVFFYYFFLARPVAGDRHAQDSSLVWLAGAVPFFASGIVRWMVLPVIKNAQTALPAFIIGIAFAEATCFLGIFVFAGHTLPLFILSVLGIFQFIPLYVSRFYRSEGF